MSNRPPSNWFEEDLDAVYDTVRRSLITCLKDTLTATANLENKLKLFRTVVEQSENDTDLEERVDTHLGDPDLAGVIQTATRALDDLRTLSVTYHHARHLHRRAKSALDAVVD